MILKLKKPDLQTGAKALMQKFGRQFNKANKKSIELTQVSKIKVEILSVKREIEEKLLELGGRTYEKLKTEQDSNLLKILPIRHLTEQLKELEAELEKYKQELEQIKAESTLNKKK